MTGDSLGAHPTERAALALAFVLLVVSSAFGIVSANVVAGAAATPEFADAFAAAARRERTVLFPLGIGTSIVTFVALVRGGHLRGRRVRLQLAAVVFLFLSGLIANGPLADAGAAISAASRDSAETMGALLERWQRLRWLSFAFVIAAAASLAAAHRAPIETIDEIGGLTSRHRLLLFLLGAATLFEGYDRFIASLALPYIGRDLGASESTLGFALSVIRLGALASIPLGRIADRRGRRGLLLFTILAYTVATAATGLSTGIVAFVVFQLLAMAFLMTELSLAQVVIAEEFPRDFRARGQAILGAFGALGAGMSALIFPIFQSTALGWRGLYFVGLLPLLLIAWLRRALPETDRWQQARDEGRTERAALGDLLSRPLRARFLALLAIAAALSSAAGPAFTFASYRATLAFAWSPEDVSGMVLFGGGLGFTGWFVFGALAERIGRRAVAAVTFVLGAAVITVYYQTSWLWLAFTGLVFAEAGASLAVTALGTEVFPTEMRSSAKTWITSAAIVGAMLGLVVVGVAAEALGGAANTITLLAAAPVLAIPLILLIPESRGRELEELAPTALGTGA